MSLKPYLLSSGLSLGACLLFFFFLEATLQTTHLFGARRLWSAPDSVITARFVPNSPYWAYKENDHPISGRINNFGWRDRDWKIKKPDDGYRIAVLGDSYVEAIQVELDSTFLKLAEKQLREHLNRPVEIMNFGRSGFTQTEELIVLQNEILRFNPNMVILCFLPSNDIADVRRQTAPHFDRPFFSIDNEGSLLLDTSFTETQSFKIRSFINPFQRRSALLSLIVQRYNAFTMAQNTQARQQKTQQNTPDDAIAGYLSLGTRRPDIEYVRSYAFNKVLIKEMAEYCHNQNIQLLLMCLDTQTYVQAVEKQYSQIDSTFDTNFFEDDLAIHADSLDIEYLGLQRLFREYYEAHATPLHWAHWNYQGHRVVAQALTEKLYGLFNEKD